jgi:D-glycero-D-manno-heptose 1,7-bisphosphate phosphatase
MTKGRRAAFLDRDGTINIERGYVTRPEDLVLIDGAAAAVRSLNEAGLLVVLVSNQSGVARGLMGEDDMARVHERLEELLAAEGAVLDGAYYCPNYSEGPEDRFTRDTSCRKPRTGMLEQAARDLDVDVAASFMVGDHSTDIEFANRAGLTAVLVMTGHGREERSETEREDLSIAHVARDLREAVAWILERIGEGAGGGAADE